MANKIKDRNEKKKEIKPRSIKQIERKITELKEEIDGYTLYGSYDLTLPSIQDEIKSRRNIIYGLLYALKREKEYDEKYFGKRF